ncbi:hypothetical protein ES702_02229 [subsurface metagenome]
MLIFTVLGIGGLSVELNKFKKIKLDNLGIGIVFGILWAIIYYLSPIWWVNIITFPLLFYAVYGILLGLINIFKAIIFSDISLKSKILVKIPLLVGQLLGIVFVILQIIKILKII